MPSSTNQLSRHILLANIRCHLYQSFYYLNQNNNTPIWKYSSKEDGKTFLHLISEIRIYNYISNEKTQENELIDVKFYIEFILFFLDYLQNKLTKEEFIEYLNRGTEQGYTALHYAAYYGNIYLLIILINKGADIHRINEAGMNLMHSAAQGNQTTIIAYLKEFHSFNVNDKDSENSTPLHWACFTGSISAVNYLVLSGADVNSIDNQKNTPLHMATDGAKLKIFRLLLQNGANPHLKNSAKKTPWQLSIEKKNNMKIRNMLSKSMKGQSLCDCTAPLAKVKGNNINKVLFFIYHIIFLAISVITIYPFLILYMKIISASIFLLLMIIFIILLIINPWQIGYANKREEFFRENYSKEKIMGGQKVINIEDYCPICLIRTKGLKITHCFICGKCSNNFDHHCYWINKDVSEKNYVFFILLLLVGLLLSGFSLVVYIMSFIQSLKDSNHAKLNRGKCQNDFISKKICFYWLSYEAVFVFYVVGEIIFILSLLIYFFFIGVLSYIHMKELIKKCGKLCKKDDSELNQSASVHSLIDNDSSTSSKV